MSKDTKITVDIPILGGRDSFLWAFAVVIIVGLIALLTS